MEISIGAYDKDAKTVPVTFTHAEVTHSRPVNAVLTDKGAYDRAKTKARVDQVALGVEVKIREGAITNPPPEPVLPTLPEPVLLTSAE